LPRMTDSKVIGAPPINKDEEAPHFPGRGYGLVRLDLFKALPGALLTNWVSSGGKPYRTQMVSGP